jgi:hypothetical protein
LSIINFFIFLGGTIFVTVSQVLFENQLARKLANIIPDLDPAILTSSGATSLQNIVPPEKLNEAMEVYNDSMRSIWYVGLALACTAFNGAFGLEWKSVKSEQENKELERRVSNA